MDDMRNLLAETLETMAEHGKSPRDVRWVGLRRFYSPYQGWQVGDWTTFARVADREYDAGFVGVEVEENLKIVGDDWWLERHKYDGSEWWEYKTLPQRPDDAMPLTFVFVIDALQ